MILKIFKSKKEKFRSISPEQAMKMTPKELKEAMEMNPVMNTFRFRLETVKVLWDYHWVRYKLWRKYKNYPGNLDGSFLHEFKEFWKEQSII